MTVLKKAKMLMCGGWIGARDRACEKREEKRYSDAIKKLSYDPLAVQRLKAIYYLSYAIPYDECNRANGVLMSSRYVPSAKASLVKQCISMYEKNRRAVPFWHYVNKRWIINWIYEKTTKNGQTKKFTRDQFIDYLVKISR
jgi:hypothetical protein